MASTIWPDPTAPRSGSCAVDVREAARLGRAGPRRHRFTLFVLVWALSALWWFQLTGLAL